MAVAVVPLLFALPLEDQFALPKLSLLAVLLGVTLILAAATGLRVGGLGSLAWPLQAVVIALVAVEAAAVWFSVDRRTSIRGLHQEYGGFASEVIYLAYFLVAAALFRRSEDAAVLAWTLTLSATVVAGYAVVQAAGVDPVDWAPLFGERVFSTIGQPIALGAYVVLSLPLVLWFAGSFRPPARWLVWGVAALLVLALVFTFSRGAYLGAAAAGAVAALLAFRRSRLRPRDLALGAMPAVVLAGTVFAVSPTARDSLSDLVRRSQPSTAEQEATVDERIALWGNALSMAVDRPALGWGPDTFATMYPSYRTAVQPGPELREVRPTTAHNEFLNRAATTGFLGLSAYLLLVGGVMAYSLRQLGLTADTKRRALLVAPLASTSGYLVQSLFGFAEVTSTWLFWLLLGMMVGVANGARTGFQGESSGQPVGGLIRREAEGARLLGGLAARVLAALAGAALIAGAVVALSADFSYARGREALEEGNWEQAISLQKRAERLNPLQSRYLRGLAFAYETVPAHRGDPRQYLRLAGDVYERLEREFAEDPWVELAHGRVLARMAQLGAGTDVEATVHLENASRLDPHDPPLRNDIGAIYMAMGNMGKAETHLLAATSAHAYPEADLNLGLLYFEQGRNDLAIPRLEAAKLDYLDRVDLFLALGGAHLVVGEAEEAIEVYEWAVLLDSTCVDAWLGLAVSELAAGDLASAETHLHEVLRLSPGNEQALMELRKLETLR